MIPTSYDASSSRLAENMTSMHGQAGREWMASIPSRVRDLENRLSISVGEPFLNLTYNYVAPCVRADGTPAVLKIGYPGEPDTSREAAALEVFDGGGMARLIDSDPAGGAVVIERAVPGDSLVSMTDDAEATCILARTMRSIRRPEPQDHDFPRVSDWVCGFERLRDCYDGGTGPMPEDLVRRAETLLPDLLATTDEYSLLHGDLHHDNVLDAGDGWLAIDPKGVIGDAAYDCAAMFYNPAGITSRPDLPDVFGTRLDIMCDVTGYDRERVLGWATTQAVLSACWELEDHGEVGESALLVARTLSDLMP